MHDDLATADLFRHGLELLLDGRIDDWVALCDEDVLVEFPFAPVGWPRRLEGRGRLAEYMSDYTDHVHLKDLPYLEIHQTAAPETVVAEMRARARLVATGQDTDISYVVVMTAARGRITHYRDYWNPLVVPDSMREAKTTAPKRENA
ncbi:nuclear transport factor 2 family protein [Nocardiopsis dassonvillei]|uniref:nuclear transport factor 2 family protein n=1 Tax=Nocardiopsis dassonvillei TaxID=2014 RepID=UPI00200C3B00|nr:nuclear transport factor 2 family protein [Nocardiopsis dassonvillei]MCK9872577.1 nuclear transport factor 2 family protein [Nocardiopsis dassonvillei]